MSARDDGGAAFPIAEQNGANTGACGMTLRDYFAAKALAGMAGQFHEHWTILGVAVSAYELADAMLAERAK